MGQTKIEWLGDATAPDVEAAIKQGDTVTLVVKNADIVKAIDELAPPDGAASVMLGSEWVQAVMGALINRLPLGRTFAFGIVLTLGWVATTTRVRVRHIKNDGERWEFDLNEKQA